jgi:uncharacterized protein YecE (DUF72 family)
MWGVMATRRLERWAESIRAWTCGAEPADAVKIEDRKARSLKLRDAYVYFDNDAKVHAPFDALHLMRRLGSEPGCDADPV